MSSQLNWGFSCRTQPALVRRRPPRMTKLESMALNFDEPMISLGSVHFRQELHTTGNGHHHSLRFRSSYMYKDNTASFRLAFPRCIASLQILGHHT
jgi:hypothetical protein